MAIMQEGALGDGIRLGTIAAMAGMVAGMIPGTMARGMVGQIRGSTAIMTITMAGTILGISAIMVGAIPTTMAIMAGDIHIIMVAAAKAIIMVIQVIQVPSIVMVPLMAIMADIIRWQTTASVWVV